MSSILITNRRLVELGGSELVSIELAEELQRQGHDVTLYSPEISDKYYDLSGLNVTDMKPRASEFELLWIHHNLLIHDLGFKKQAGQKIIFNHMSSYVDLEWPKLPDYELALADMILANSWETAQKLKEFGIHAGLFQNPAPIGFESCEGYRDKALFISNHRPDELTRYVSGLGIESKWIGHGDTPMRITPEVLSEAAFVVCNGKTVQYAMRAGVPVFLYDHFKGCGWIDSLTPKEFDIVERHNFSGRGGVETNLINIKDWREAVPVPCADRFKLEVVLNEILN